jgi:hypothetical protein
MHIPETGPRLGRGKPLFFRFPEISFDSSARRIFSVCSYLFPQFWQDRRPCAAPFLPLRHRADQRMNGPGSAVMSDGKPRPSKRCRFFDSTPRLASRYRAILQWGLNFSRGASETAATNAGSTGSQPAISRSSRSRSNTGRTNSSTVDEVVRPNAERSSANGCRTFVRDGPPVARNLTKSS